VEAGGTALGMTIDIGTIKVGLLSAWLGRPPIPAAAAPCELASADGPLPAHAASKVPTANRDLEMIVMALRPR
jgi:hypothetical protein